MRNQKVLNTNQVKWYDDEITRLTYQMIFNEPDDLKTEDEGLDQEELETRLEERNEFWKKKLNKVKEEAFAEGFKTGKNEGLEHARKEIDGKLEVIRTAIDTGHKEWRQRMEIIEPGVLDLAFDISEAILGIPVQDEKVRENMTEKLTPIFQKLDKSSKPILTVSEYDLEHVQKLKEEFDCSLTMFIQTDKNCNPGEFKLDTNDETFVYKFREMLQEFKKNLSVPTWN